MEKEEREIISLLQTSGTDRSSTFEMKFKAGSKPARPKMRFVVGSKTRHQLWVSNKWKWVVLILAESERKWIFFTRSGQRENFFSETRRRPLKIAAINQTRVTDKVTSAWSSARGRSLTIHRIFSQALPISCHVWAALLLVCWRETKKKSKQRRATFNLYIMLNCRWEANTCWVRSLSTIESQQASSEEHCI